MATQAQVSGRAVHPVFEGISHIKETRLFDQQKDGKCFDALRDHFSRHQMRERFVMTLLHTHFPIFDDEIFVTRFYRDKRVAVGEVQPVKEGHGVLPWSFRLFGQAGQERFMPNQYLAITPDVAEYDLSLSDRDREFLVGMSSILRVHGALDRFGVQVHVPLLEEKLGEYLIEDTDDENRTATISFIGEEEFKISRSVQTYWCFSHANVTSPRCRWHLQCRETHQE